MKVTIVVVNMNLVNCYLADEGRQWPGYLGSRTFPSPLTNPMVSVLDQPILQFFTYQSDPGAGLPCSAAVQLFNYSTV